MIDPTIILPKPTTDPDEFEVRVGDLYDACMSSGRGRHAVAAVMKYQAQCFALFLRENARKPLDHSEWGGHRINEQFEVLDHAINAIHVREDPQP